jgi:hypothetical protein
VEAATVLASGGQNRDWRPSKLLAGRGVGEIAMTLRTFSKWLGVVAVAGAVSVGCKGDEPKPVKPDTSASSSAAKPKARVDIPKMSPQATKEFRVDSCYFGTLSLRQTRDAYLASLGSAEPSEKKIPSFGDLPELDAAGKRRSDAAPGTTVPPSGSAGAKAAPPPKGTDAAKAPAPKATAGAKATATPGTKAPGGGEAGRPAFAPNRLPFTRYVHSCTLAKNVPGADDPKIDEPLKAYEEYVVALNKQLMQASQYYSREEYKKDQLAKGKELHKQLTEAFGKLDEKVSTFGAAVVEWRKGLGKLPDQLDPSGDIALAAIADARQLTFTLLGKEPDAAAIKAALDKLTSQADALDKEGQASPQAAFPKMVGPSLRAFLENATAAHAAVEAKKALNAEQLFLVAASFTTLSESGNRGITRHLYANRTPGAGAPGSAAIRPMPQPDRPMPAPPPQ